MTTARPFVGKSLSARSESTSRGNRKLSLWALVSVLLLPVGAFAQGALLDGFERTTPAPWTVRTGTSVPEGTATLRTVSNGQSGQGLRVDFDFPADGAADGGSYLAATLAPLPTSVGAPHAISFFADVPAGVRLSLQVTDAEGQTLRYDVARPVTSVQTPGWFEVYVPLGMPTSFSGGEHDGVIHGGLTELAILATQPLATAALSGYLQLDEVTLWSDNTATLDPSRPVDVALPAGSPRCGVGNGVVVHPQGTPDDFAHEIDVAKAANLSVIRSDVRWADTEKDAGIYDFSTSDKYIHAITDGGLTPLLILDYSNRLYTGSPSVPPTTAAEQTAFAKFAGQVAQHYRGHHTRYEIWNEPNISVYWPTGPNGTQYGTLASGAEGAIKAADPEALVTSAGVGHYDFKFFGDLFDAGGASRADAAAVHPYRRTGPETQTDELVLMRSLLAERPRVLPLWQTEWGYSAQWFFKEGTDAAYKRQATLLSRMLLSSCALEVPTTILYDVRDDGADAGNASNDFGLVAYDFSHKPAFDAVAKAQRTLLSHTTEGMWKLPQSPIVAMKLTSSNDTTAVVWNSTPSGDFHLRVPRPAAIYNVYGWSLAIPAADAQGQIDLVLAEAQGPLYLVYPRGGSSAAASSPASVSTDAGAARLGASHAQSCAEGGLDAGSAFDFLAVAAFARRGRRQRAA